MEGGGEGGGGRGGGSKIMSTLSVSCLSVADRVTQNKDPYHINTNEIPGELSRENMISSHMKITCYLHM